jgi:hypothetical protein
MFKARHQDSAVYFLDLRRVELIHGHASVWIEQGRSHSRVDRMAPKYKARLNSARADVRGGQALAEVA